MIVGYNLPISDFTEAPYEFKNMSYAMVTDLSAIPYTEGDYLLINIIPRVKEPETFDTNWDFYCICMSEWEVVDIPDGFNAPVLEDLTMTYNESQCRWELPIDTEASYLNTVFNDHKYFTLTYEYYSSIYLLPNDVTQTILYPSGITYFQNNILYNELCEQLDGSLTCVRVGDVLTYAFSSETDYLAYKDRYEEVVDTVYMSYSYSSDNTNVNHFYFWVLPFWMADECGDTVYRWKLEINI